MRVHRDGYIQASSLEIAVSDDMLRRCRQAYSYMTLGFEMEINKVFGIEIEGAERVRILAPDPDDRQMRILIESSWKRSSASNRS